MSGLRNNAPLLDAYLSYFEEHHISFTIPGHKHKASLLDEGLGRVVDSDLPLFGGLDEIKLTHNVLDKAEKLAANLWGAQWAKFSTGGSTHANQAIVLALGKPGDKVAISRTAHRSVLSALVLSGLEPIWMFPEIDAKTGVPVGIPLSEIERVSELNPVAILLTEPGYLGTLSDLSPIIEKAHSKNIGVVIDAAWGAHFGFHSAIPAHAISLGADALVTSVHKNLPGYSAAALLLVQGSLINRERLNQSFETTHTTSPAGAPLASIDGSRALLETRGEELIKELLHNVETFKNHIESSLDKKVFLSPEDFKPGRFDPTKIVLQTAGIGVSGVELESEIRKGGIRVEMADRDTVVFLVTLADTHKDFLELTKVLNVALLKLRSEPRPVKTSLSWSVKPEQEITPREAYFADTEIIGRSEAAGRISADLIAPYPPGVAVLAPGEKITETILAGLIATQADGVRIAYATDPSLQSFRVVK
ncbi:MAG: aminotransferase class V-fold PLP-dependent enzyme [Actinomycetes bacterium]